MSEIDKNSKNQRPKTSALAKGSVSCVLLGAGLWLTDILLDLAFGEGGFLLGIGMWLILAGLVLGAAATISILLRRGRTKGVAWSCGAIALGLVLLWSMVYFFKQHVASANQVICQHNLYNLWQVVRMYSTENQGDLPTGSNWCDLVCSFDIGPKGYPSTISKSTLSCGNAPGAASTYALNENLEGLTFSEIPEDAVFFFEAAPGWNQIGGPELLNTHNHEEKGCNVLFGDARVEFVPTDQLNKLRWRVEEAEK